MSLTSITFCGHAAVLLTIGGKIIAIDPWLMGNPACPPQYKKPKAIDLICLTHGHADHAGDTVELYNTYHAQVAATWDLCSALNESGIPEEALIRLNLGGEAVVDTLKIKVALTLAYHSSNFIRPDGVKVVAGDAAGVVVTDHNGFSVYHAGDTALFSDIALIKQRHAPQVGLFPIGDRVTMGPVEAAYAAKLSGVKIAIPIHYGTFPIFTGTPDVFSKECASHGITAITLAPGEELTREKMNQYLL